MNHSTHMLWSRYQLPTASVQITSEMLTFGLPILWTPALCCVACINCVVPGKTPARRHVMWSSFERKGSWKREVTSGGAEGGSVFTGQKSFLSYLSRIHFSTTGSGESPVGRTQPAGTFSAQNMILAYLACRSFCNQGMFCK